MRNLVSLTILFIALALAPSRAQEIGDVDRGRRYAQSVCAECHAVGPGELSRHAKAPSFKAIANSPGMTATALAVWFQTSHRTMPNLVIEHDTVDDLSAYILSMRGRK
jgi:mono/diheme cytochrome c family protein